MTLFTGFPDIAITRLTLFLDNNEVDSIFRQGRDLSEQILHVNINFIYDMIY